jgi:hypothetical protein
MRVKHEVNETWGKFTQGWNAIEYDSGLLVIEPHPEPRMTQIERTYLDGLALITAHNPGGVITSAEENAASDDALLNDLRELEGSLRIYRSYDGRGGNRDPRTWEFGESGWAVNVSREEAVLLGEKYGQLAVYVFERGSRLLLPCTYTEPPVITQSVRVSPRTF